MAKRYPTTYFRVNLEAPRMTATSSQMAFAHEEGVTFFCWEARCLGLREEGVHAAQPFPWAPCSIGKENHGRESLWVDLW